MSDIDYYRVAIKSEDGAMTGEYVLEVTYLHKEWQTGESSSFFHPIDTRQGHLQSTARFTAWVEANTPWTVGMSKIGVSRLLDIKEGSGSGGAWSQSRHGLFQGENLGHMRAKGDITKWRSAFIAHARSEAVRFTSEAYVKEFLAGSGIQADVVTD